MHGVRCLGEFGINVSLGSPRPSAFIAFPVDDVGNQTVEFGTLFVGEEFLVGVLGGPLQRDVNFSRPDPLKIWLPPLRLWGWSCFGDRRCLNVRRGRPARDDARQRYGRNGYHHCGRP